MFQTNECSFIKAFSANVGCFFAFLNVVGLKSFLNNKKIPCIPPLIHNNEFVVDLKERSELFNPFFANQCTLIKIRSNLSTQILRRSNKSSNTINFTESDS